MKRISQVVCLLLVFSLILPICAQANVEASDYFGTDECFLLKVSSTEFKICFDVTGTGLMKEIGTSVITVQRSLDGSDWTDMKTYTKEANPEMICVNNFTYGTSLKYTSATPGYYYRAYVKFYAKNSNGIGEMPRYTSKIKL